MKRNVRTGIAALSIAVGLAIVGCTPAPGGGGGEPGQGALNTGCFETVFGPNAGRFEIWATAAPIGPGPQYWLESSSTTYCSGLHDDPTPIYPGNPGPFALDSCQLQHGPEASVTQQLSAAIVPHQTFWMCNYPFN